MVLLTMTPAIVQGLDTLGDAGLEAKDEDPSLLDAKIGNPISHTQLLNLSKALKAKGRTPYHLDLLLRGAKVYIPSPPPKAEKVHSLQSNQSHFDHIQTSEYKALMARLRAEEESRAYERMLNPPAPLETFSQRFPNSAAHAFSSTASHMPPEADDDMSFANVNSQMALIANVLISVICCAAAIWMVARWWSTPARLALSMSGSFVVGAAEVVIYMGYVRRVDEAKGKEARKKEVKEVLRTWVVGGDEGMEDDGVKVSGVKEEVPAGVRKRKK